MFQQRQLPSSNISPPSLSSSLHTTSSTTTPLTPSGANLTTSHMLKTANSSSSSQQPSSSSTNSSSKLLMMNSQQTTTQQPPSNSFHNSNMSTMMWWNGHHQPMPPPQVQPQSSSSYENNLMMNMFNNNNNTFSGGGLGGSNRHSDVAINTVGTSSVVNGGSSTGGIPSSWFQQQQLETNLQQHNQQHQMDNQFYHHQQHQQWMMNNPPSGMWPPPPGGMMMNPILHGYPMMMCSVDDIEKSFFNDEPTTTEPTATSNNGLSNIHNQPPQSHFLSQFFPQQQQHNNQMLNNNDIKPTTTTSATTSTVQPAAASVTPSTSSLEKVSPILGTTPSLLMNEIRNLQIQLKAALKVLELERQKLSSITSKDTHYIVANQTLEETIRHVKKSLNIVKKKQIEEKKSSENVQQSSTTLSNDESSSPRTLENHYKFRKYSENMYGFFPKHLVNKVRFDSELALSYLTPFNDAFEIASLMNEMIKQKTGFYPNHLIDGTGGLGGNIIGFLRYFWSKRLHRKTVTMIELDERRCNDARYNINLFENEERKFDRDCVTCGVVSGNFIDWWQKERSNLVETMSETFVFFDPPWGNQDYSLHDFIDDLYMIQENLTPISVKTFSKQLLLDDGVQCVALKVPYNFSESGLPEELEVEYILMKKVKYIMLFRKTETADY